MSYTTLKNIDLSNPDTETREIYTDVGSDPFHLGQYTRAFFVDGLEVWDSAVGGVQLTLDVDYEFVQRSDYYSKVAFRAGLGQIYTTIRILNVAYQTGNIYITYDWAGTFPTAEMFEDLQDQISAIAGAGMYETIDADYTILDTDLFQYLLCDTTTAGKRITVTLPTLADNQTKKPLTITVIGNGGVLFDGEGAETINSLASISLYSDGDRISVIPSATEWKITQLKAVITTGAINTNDYTDREIGNRNLNYDNLAGVFVIGELVIEYSDAGYTTPTGMSGYICTDSGTILILRDVTGGGTFINNLYLRGESSGATALVNHATAIKNQNSNVYHGWGVSATKIRTILNVWDTTIGGTETNLKRSLNLNSSNPGTFNTGIIGIDTNNFKLQTGVDGLHVMGENGLAIAVDTDEYCYQIFTYLDI